MRKQTDYEICKADDSHVRKIVELFKKTYKNGYCTSLFECESDLKEFLKDENFIGLVAVMPDQTIIGFSGLYFEKCDYAKNASGIMQAIEDRKRGLKTHSISNIHHVYLANFVVDEEYRGLGVGKAIEAEKDKICSSLPGQTVIYSFVVEDSAQSIKLKLDYDYDIWGTRVFYHTLDNGEKGHILIMGKVVGCDKKEMYMEPVSDITAVLVNNSSKQIVRRIQKNNENPQFKRKVVYDAEPAKNRVYCNVKYDPNGDSIETIIQNIKNKKGTYAAIYIEAQDIGIHNADKILIQNNFFPVVILPHFADGKDIIEYQYIDDALASMIPDCLINKNEIVSYLKNKQ